jgi:hypothetical protein
VTAQSGVNVGPLNFGNEFVCNRNGKTLGFWSNTNGQSLIVQADIDALNALNLRTSAGGNADFTGTLDQEKAALKAFLQGGTATNMANMLSVQLASTVLDLRHGYFGTSQAIYVDSVLTNWAGNSQGANLAKNLDHDGNSNNADPSGNVNQFGFAAIGDSAATAGLIKAANDELGLHPTAVAGNTWRAYQEALKIAFDGMNNNQAVFATCVVVFDVRLVARSEPHHLRSSSMLVGFAPLDPPKAAGREAGSSFSSVSLCQPLRASTSDASRASREFRNPRSPPYLLPSPRRNE